MRKILYSLALLLALLLPAAPAYASNGPGNGRVIIGQDYTLKSGDTLNGDLVVIGGDTSIEKSAVVIGDVVVIGGSLQLDGESKGNAVVIGGVASLGAGSSVAGDLITVGGTLQRSETARVGGNVITNLPPPELNVPVAPTAAIPPAPPPPAFRFDFGPLGTLAGLVGQALGLAALAMLLTLFLHPQLDRVAQALTRQPIVAGSIGMLTIVLTPVAVLILVVTLILIPVALAAVVLLVVAWLFGVVALGMEVGDRLTRALHRTWEPVLAAGAGTLLLSLAVGIINLVPCVGWLAPFLVGLVGLGAAVTTVFGTRPGPLMPLPAVGNTAPPADLAAPSPQ